MAMNMRPVFSSHINRIGYDDDAGEVRVEFSNGSIVHYHEIPDRVARDLLSAPSIGQELHRGIKRRGYQFKYHQKAKPKSQR